MEEQDGEHPTFEIKIFPKERTPWEKDGSKGGVTEEARVVPSDNSAQWIQGYRTFPTKPHRSRSQKVIYDPSLPALLSSINLVNGPRYFQRRFLEGWSTISPPSTILPSSKVEEIPAEGERAHKASSHFAQVYGPYRGQGIIVLMVPLKRAAQEHFWTSYHSMLPI